MVSIVSGAITPPARVDVPHFPADAQAAGVKGVVVLEIAIDPSGHVTDAKVIQSIPLLDEEALRAVSQLAVRANDGEWSTCACEDQRDCQLLPASDAASARAAALISATTAVLEGA